jgi:hypothetical protein
MRQAARRDQLEVSVVAALRQVGFVVVHHSGPGEPDLFVSRPGMAVYLALEVKAPRGHLTPAQVAFPGPRVLVHSVQEALDAAWDVFNPAHKEIA